MLVAVMRSAQTARAAHVVPSAARRLPTEMLPRAAHQMLPTEIREPDAAADRPTR